jgi:hypothetical protein
LLIDFNTAWQHKRSYCKAKALFAEGIISSWFLQEINKNRIPAGVSEYWIYPSFKNSAEAFSPPNLHRLKTNNSETHHAPG